MNEEKDIFDRIMSARLFRPLWPFWEKHREVLVYLFIGGMTPLDPKIDILGGSSDHTILDVTKSDKEYKVGDVVSFKLDYGAVLKLATSAYVEKAYI